MDSLITFSWTLFNATHEDPDESESIPWERIVKEKHDPIDQTVWEEDLANTKPTDQALAFLPNSRITKNVSSMYVRLEAWKTGNEYNKGL